MKDSLLSINSTCEEVGNYFAEKFKINEEEKKIIIDEKISGDILLDITDFKNIFHFRPGPSNKIQKFLKVFQDKYRQEKNGKKISVKNEEEIKAFFENYIGFKGNLNNIKGEKELKQLKEEDMKQLGLNLIQNYLNILII